MIPKVIHKIIIVDDGKMPKLSNGMKTALETFYRMNPGYKIKLYSGNDCVNYIKLYFDDKVLKTYNAIKPYAFKCDFMRQLILFNEGGWYSDIRQVCLEPIDKLNAISKEYYTCMDSEINPNCMYNAFIGSIPHHPISSKMIDLIIWNVSHKHYGLDCLYVTGPGAYMNACIDYIRHNGNMCCIGKHTMDEYIKFGDIKFMKCKYNDARGADNSDLSGTNDYGDMWRKRNVY